MSDVVFSAMTTSQKAEFLAASNASAAYQRKAERILAAGRAAKLITSRSDVVVTYGADGANSTIRSNYQTTAPLYSVAAPEIRQIHGKYTLLSGRYSSGFMSTYDSVGALRPLVGSQGTGVEFCTDADAFEFSTRTTAANTFRVLVDEGDGFKYLEQTAAPATTNGDFPAPSSASATNYVKVQFASAKVRTIRLQFQINMQWFGIVVGLTYRCWLPKGPRRPIVHLTGDSYTGAGGGIVDYLSGSWALRMGDAMGCEVIPAGISGQGIVDQEQSQQIYSTYMERIPDVTMFGQVDMCLVTSFINDFLNGQSPAAVQAALQSWLTQVRALQPTALIGVVGPFTIQSIAIPSAFSTAIAAAYNAAKDSGMFFVNAQPWISGTGKQGSTTGNGNSDIYIRADGVHPTQAGHDYIGYKAAGEINAALEAML